MGSNVAFDGHREELTGGLGVADRTPVAHAEHRGEVQRVGAVDERLLELAIHAEAVWAARPAEMLLHEAAAGDRCHSICGLLGDDHVGIGGVGPAVAPVRQKVQQRLPCEVVERARPPAYGQAPVTEGDVLEDPDFVDHAAALAEAVTDLDDWFQRGGFLPARWRPAEYASARKHGVEPIRGL